MTHTRFFELGSSGARRPSRLLSSEPSARSGLPPYPSRGALHTGYRMREGDDGTRARLSCRTGFLESGLSRPRDRSGRGRRTRGRDACKRRVHCVPEDVSVRGTFPNNRRGRLGGRVAGLVHLVVRCDGSR